MVRRIGRTLAACAALASMLGGSAHAAPGLLVGVADDTPEVGGQAQAQAGARLHARPRAAGGAGHRSVAAGRDPPRRGRPPARRPDDPGDLGRAACVSSSPCTERRRTRRRRTPRQTQYCTFAASLLRRYPGVNDVVVWNEPNTSRFWRPQFDAEGNSVAPAAYEALLARCWDVLHAARPGVNVIAASAPRGNDNPTLSRRPAHSPVTFYRKLGARLPRKRAHGADPRHRRPQPVPDRRTRNGRGSGTRPRRRSAKATTTS